MESVRLIEFFYTKMGQIPTIKCLGELELVLERLALQINLSQNNLNVLVGECKIDGIY